MSILNHFLLWVQLTWTKVFWILRPSTLAWAWYFFLWIYSTAAYINQSFLKSFNSVRRRPSAGPCTFLRLVCPAPANVNPSLLHFIYFVSRPHSKLPFFSMKCSNTSLTLTEWPDSLTSRLIIAGLMKYYTWLWNTEHFWGVLLYRRFLNLERDTETM